MKFIEYFKLTKRTSNNLMNISLLIFSSIVFIMFIIIEYDNLNLSVFLKFLAISIFFGLLFSVFILSIAILVSFQKIKPIINLYNSTLKEIREKCGLIIYEKDLNFKFNYLEFEIIATKRTEYPIKFDLVNSQIWITIYNNVSKIENFNKKRLSILKKYRKEKIELTGWGLKKVISKNEWKNITESDFKKIVNQLKSISETENLEMYDFEKTGYNTG
ncbi:hypothetical protein AXE80_07225 [Wenyingzhuangia fucanilytica]|uniref:Uncharacterized protein n=1 Tax=Wenyingzhuangia fucanilytica TaxID=1790137 RepID=A0A1B1Y5L9_9FLAO|nr:hypothetical protein [Wenyingzhuangia fucanilytica]ANW96081.1 hypothetical protein AXE80_07225 [Wenyingzhuangia fucanilytica]